MSIDCLVDLVGLKDLCADSAVQPLFWLDDAESIDRASIASLAKPSNGSGKAFATEIIEASSRFLMADIETLVPKGYGVKSTLNSFCNVCTYTSITTGTAVTGVVVKNLSTTTNGYLSIDSLKVLIASTGTFNIVLDDGVEPKLIEHAFTAGVEVVITNIKYKTTAKSVKVYFFETPVLVYALSCPTTKSCGCSGSTATSKDISVKGLLADEEFTTQYGFIPCASVVCSMDNVICSIVNQQPRLFGLALFYRATARLFAEPAVTERNNVFASYSKERKQELADYYLALYYERLRGSENVKGIVDNLAATMNNLNDPCVTCDRKTSTAWAIG